MIAQLCGAPVAGAGLRTGGRASPNAPAAPATAAHVAAMPSAMLSGRRVACMQLRAGCTGASAPALPAGMSGRAALLGAAPMPAVLAGRVVLRARAAGAAGPVRCAAGEAAAPWGPRDCRLVLEDGSVWKGRSFGAEGTRVMEVVFNTSLSGYQEIITDPSYKGQAVVFTYPHIGNVGVNPEDMESTNVHMDAVIVRDLSCAVSNYRATQSLSDWLKQEGVMGIADVDTRAITRRLRETGCLVGAITTDASISDEDLIKMTKEWTIVGKDLIAEVTCKEAYQWVDPTDAEWEFSAAAKASNGEKYKIVAYDFGIKHNILRRLAAYGCDITVVPASTPAEDVLAMNPDGIFLSNGPGDPSAVPYAVESVKALLGKKPMFGICMGHQVLGQALGGSTFKLKFGHHGGNHPIRYAPTGRVEISAQNHNFAVDPDSLPEGAVVTHINLNDGTCAGLSVPQYNAISIQYHPEASPGPHDGDMCFEQFIEMVKAAKTAKVAA